MDDGPEAVLAALDPEQREVALATRGPVCVIAGAGTGKTRAIAHRVAYAVRTGVVNPGHVLAVTFNTRAAGELRGRLRQLDGPGGYGLDQVTARTFHSAALRQLVHFWPATVGGRPGVVRRAYLHDLGPLDLGGQVAQFRAARRHPRHAGRLAQQADLRVCLLYTSPSPRDGLLSRMPSSA